MPLFRRDPFVPNKPSSDLKAEDEVFVCEATKEVFKDYEEFFQRTILCNSLVWSCSITGKANLTYEEAVESEKSARKRLGKISKPLKRGLVWLAHQTQRGRFADLADDVYVFANARYFIGEVVEAIVNDQWCDCKIIKVVPPTLEEIEKDAQEEKESEEKAKKPKKSFSPPEHLFKYELEEVDPDEGEAIQIHTIEAEDIRREKGTYTREKNNLFLKNLTELGKDGNFCLKKSVVSKLQVDEINFTDIFAGPQPVFEVTKRAKSASQNVNFVAKKKVEGKSQQGTLDGWVKGEKTTPVAAASEPAKKKTPEELEAEIKRNKEQSERFKEDLKRRTEEARKRKIEEKNREKERKKEEKKLLTEVLSEWKKTRDDLECEDLKALPKPKPVHCRIPNHLFGDFLSLLEFFGSFSELMEVKDSFSSGITFDVLESALRPVDTPGGSLFDLLNFLLGVIFDLQHQEDEEVRLEKLSVGTDVSGLDRNVLGKDEDIAGHIRSATKMARWSIKHQGGQALHELHMNEYSITEILRLHLESAGGYRSDKSSVWTYQQRGGYRLADDPGLQFRMDEPQILEALGSKSVYELSTDEKMKILNCLMLQVLSFTTPRDEIDEKFNELQEAKSELRNHQIAENKRIRMAQEAEKARKKEETSQKKEDDLKVAENASNSAEDQKKTKDDELAKMTDRQREAIMAQKEKEEKERQKKEDSKKFEAQAVEKTLIDRVIELQAQIGPTLLGRDRAYRRFWILESLPGIFVEHDDDFVGSCLPAPTPFNPNAGPLDEAAALEKVKKILDGREQSDEKSSSDKENDREDGAKVGEVSKTYSKKNSTAALKQKVLAAKNGSVTIKTETTDEENAGSSSNAGSGDVTTVEMNGVVKRETADEDVEMTEQKFSHIEQLPWGACLADQEICPVHSTILPKTHWSFYSTVDELDDLIESLNVRGIREHELKEKLVHERDRIVKSLKKAPAVVGKIAQDDEDLAKLEKKEGRKDEESIAGIVDLTLRDQILEMEEKIFFGTLGSLKIRDRAAWQKAIQNGSYDKQCDTLAWGGRTYQDTPFESRIASALGSRDTTRPSTPDPNQGGSDKRDSTGSGYGAGKRQSRKVHDLACAILQVAQMMDPKYLKDPLGEDEKEKKKRLKEEERKKKERDAEEADGVIVEHQTSTEMLTPMQEWENSLMESTSYAQLYIHLTTLESSISWSKSVMNAKCRICRRKTDPEKMLLCDGCDRGHHMFCLKPKLRSVPQGDWYCHDCKPKERLRSPKKKTTRRVFSTEEDDEGSDSEDAPLKPKAVETESENSDSDEAVDSDEENEDVDEDSPPRRKKSRRDVELPKKTKKSTKQQQQEEAAEAKKNAAKKKKGGLSQLLGKRRCATEANERIARVVNQESHSGNSSGSEAPTLGERASSRLRSKPDSQASSSTAATSSSSRSSKSRVSDGAVGGSQARSKRRRAVDDKLEAVFNPTVLEDLLNTMMKHKDGWPFDRPITKADAPDYHKIIERPMDLGTIRSNIIRMKYTCNQEVLDDIRQVFVNCFTYNRPEAEEFQCGVRLEKYFLKEMKKFGFIDDDEEPQSGNFQNNPPPSKKSRRTF